MDDDLHAGSKGEIDQRVDVGEGAVDAAIGAEAHQVEAPACALCLGDDLLQHVVRPERPFGDLDVDARDIHLRDASGAEVQVPHFAVAHLPVGEPDVAAARGDEGVRVAGVHRVDGRLLRLGDGVVGVLGALAVAVEDHEEEGTRALARHRAEP